MSELSRHRRGYLDWIRGVAVVVMIGAHTFDAWTLAAEKTSTRYWFVTLIAGMAAPLFLFLAGVSVSLATGSRTRRGLAAQDVARCLIRRGLWIWVLALLFRVQAFVLSPGATLYGILKVDILNIMGPAIAAAALLWGLASTFAARMAALVAAAVLFGCTTPLVRDSTWIGMLPDPLEWYLRPVQGRATFTLFPWAGFVFAGAALGTIIDRLRSAADERRANLAFASGGLALVGIGYGASLLPSLFDSSRFWTSSPSFFLLRVGVVIVAIALAYAWAQRPTARRFSPLRQLGVTSLFVYWIHVELAYGIASDPLHGTLPLGLSFVAFFLFALLMFGASMWKTRVVSWWKARDSAQTVPLAGSQQQA